MKEEQVKKAIELFRNQFQVEPEIVVFAPGRANLIGEHTDYHEGFVLAFALPQGTAIAGLRLPVSAYSSIVSSDRPEEVVEFHIDETLQAGQLCTASYVKRMILQYRHDLPMGAAFLASVVSDIPSGSGLSSAASLEVAAGTLLEQLFDLRVSNLEKLRRCQKAEPRIKDLPTGFVDQFIAIHGQAGYLIFIDCRSQRHHKIPFCGHQDDNDLQNIMQVMISSPKVKNSWNRFPNRVRQCNEALTLLQQKYPGEQIKSLRDVSLEMLEESQEILPLLSFKRVRHVISENQRVLTAVECLEQKNFPRLGQLLMDSHSLRDDYGVSCNEVDFLQQCTLTTPRVYGSRITGCGFGGSIIALLEKDAIPEFEKCLKVKYYESFGEESEVTIVFPSNGVEVIIPKDLNDRYAVQGKGYGELLSRIMGRWSITAIAVLCATGAYLFYSRRK